MLRLGIAGCRHGHIFSLYDVAMKSPRVEVVGAWEDDVQAKEAAKLNYGMDFNYQSYEDMLADSSIDAVAIGNYYGARGKMAIEALKAGKHVIADKPLCTSLEELREIEKLAKENSLSVGLMLDLREHKNVLAARRIISDGKIGEVHNIQFGGQHPLFYGTRPSWYFEEGKHGGVINDIAIHGIDLISYLTGLEVKKIVGARCWNAYATEEPDFKDCGQLLLELSNSAGVIADISYAVPNSIGFNNPYYWEFKIWGSKGMISFSANTDGVDLYLDGSTEVEKMQGESASVNYLDSFINDIEKENIGSLCTETVFKVAETTLKIQQKANEWC